MLHRRTRNEEAGVGSPGHIRHAPRGRAAAALLGAWLLVIAGVVPGVGALVEAGAAATEGAGTSGLVEVGRLPILPPPELPGDGFKRSGWLILDTKHRFAYQVFESGLQTFVQSFDLDTLAPRRRVTLTGRPILTGYVASIGAPTNSGEVVHAVDEDAGRLYLALAPPTVEVPDLGAVIGGSPDGKRQFGRIVVFDEERFDADPDTGLASFALAPTESRLMTHYLMGLATTRHHTADPKGRAKLLALF